MLLSIKILVLLWIANLAPVLLAFFLGTRWRSPVDCGRCFRDGRPLFGEHKTIRGVMGASAAGALTAVLLGLPAVLGFLTGLLSMTGDLVSSFSKRRLGLPSGSSVPGLDQAFEGLLPFAVLGPYFSLETWHITLLAAVFAVSAFTGSWLIEKRMVTRRRHAHSRATGHRSRIREWRACTIANNPLHPFFNFERAVYYHLIMKSLFRMLCIYKKGQTNATRLRRQKITCYFEDLPIAFDGYTILFLSDLHLDGLDGLTENLQDLVAETPVDLCILGGDYRMEMSGPFTEALMRLSRLTRKITACDGIYAILGNHDCLEMITPLQKLGISFLVNDSSPVDRDGRRIWIVGVDDPHYFQCHDLQEAFKYVPQDAFAIFAAHSPEVYRDAAALGARFYLCGHTHAGQIQLPKIGPVFTHSKAPRQFSHGSWQYRGMLGYTSAGAGASGIPVRFGCQGEVVLITLKNGFGRNEILSH